VYPEAIWWRSSAEWHQRRVELGTGHHRVLRGLARHGELGSAFARLGEFEALTNPFLFFERQSLYPLPLKSLLLCTLTFIP
jgi:hypothetical protein